MRKTPTLTITFVVCLIALTALGAIIRYTDKPNAIPVGSDFFSLQRNQDYINASVNQFSNMLFTAPFFTGNGQISGNWTVSGTIFGNGAGISNFGTLNYILSTNGIGSNPTFYNGGTFFGVYYFDEVDAKNFFPTNFFINFTNYPFLRTDGNGQLQLQANGTSLTNLTYAYNTNIVGAANFVFGQAYWTNASANFTFPALTENANYLETLVVMVTNSSAATITATINGVAGAPGHVVPAVFYCTNATVTEIDVTHFGVLWTNACVGKN